jgi:hypothetical protein
MNYTEFFQFLKNWFEVERVFGDFKIEKNGTITKVSGDTDMAALLLPDQLVRIIGSRFNDGVWRYPLGHGRPEEFNGAVWAMAVPPAVVDLSNAIQEWANKYGEAVNSPYASESFGDYSYTRASGQGNTKSNGNPTWQGQFASELNKWRKI